MGKPRKWDLNMITVKSGQELGTPWFCVWIYWLKVKSGSHCCYEIQFFILVHAMSSEFTREVVKSSVVQVSFLTQYNVLIHLQELYQFKVGKTLIRPRPKSAKFQSKIYSYYPFTNTNLILKMVAGMTMGIPFWKISLLIKSTGEVWTGFTAYFWSHYQPSDTIFNLQIGVHFSQFNILHQWLPLCLKSRQSRIHNLCKVCF